MPEEKLPRLYVALQNGVRIRRLSENLLSFIKDEILFSCPANALPLGFTYAALPCKANYEKHILRISRSPDGVHVQIVKKDVPIFCLAANNFPFVGDNSFELPTGYAVQGWRTAGQNGQTLLIHFRDISPEPGPDLFLPHNIAKAIHDLPNIRWVWPQKEKRDT